MRGGMNGTVLAMMIIQIGEVIGMRRETDIGYPVVELQAFVAALTLTGLFLGMMVDEKERASERLRQTLRLAAAGEMAGAVAHEVTQPLTALANYGRSAQLLVTQGGPAAGQLPGVVEKMVAEAQRAGEVVQRLRDFFRTGTTRLELVSMDEALTSARAIAGREIKSANISVEFESESDLPPLYVDRLQLELVLRNLLANAVDAVAGVGGHGGRIRVLAQRHDPDHVRLVVADSGPGLPATVRNKLFEPLSTGKSGGSGFGLALSRAIAEAHGGSLEARLGEHGEFHLVLPCARKT